MIKPEYSLNVFIADSRKAMGKRAARIAAEKINGLLESEREINCVFAAAPSQNEFIECLLLEDVDFGRINAYHMDEYVGLSAGDSRTFAAFLKERLFDRADFASVHLISAAGKGADEQISAYSSLLREKPIDITFMGIGENGHIAFNDPHVADFSDPALIKLVALDEACRQQQVNDKCFATLDEVPKEAVTLTIPALMSAKSVICVVPGPTKTNAVTASLRGEITQRCPASIMRLHPDCSLFLDAESARGLRDTP